MHWNYASRFKGGGNLEWERKENSKKNYMS